MTDNDIIKALECLSGEEIFCKDCGFSRLESRGFACKKNVSIAALDLINRQKAEIEMLKAYDEMADGYADAVEQNAIKEFAERLKAETISFVEYDEGGWGERVTAVKTSSIDNLVKEMTEKGGEQE